MWDQDRSVEQTIAAIRAELAALGKDPDMATAADLEPVDNWHRGGGEAIRRHLALLGAGPGEQVLDLGCGCGGPARLIASETGAAVVGLDLNPAWIALGQALSAWSGLAEQVRLVQGDATAAPFPDQSFDRALSVHVHMFIEAAQKPAFYAEAFRVLRPGGRFLVYDPVALAPERMLYPAPWAGGPGEDHAVSAAALRAHLTEAGFEILEEIDRSAEAAGDRAAAKAAPETPSSRLAPPLILGPHMPERQRNAMRNAENGAVGYVTLLARRP